MKKSNCWAILKKKKLDKKRIADIPLNGFLPRELSQS